MAFGSKLDVSLSSNSVGNDPSRLPDVGAVKNYVGGLSVNSIDSAADPSKLPTVSAVQTYTWSAADLNTQFQKYYPKQDTSSATELDGILSEKLDSASAFPGFVEFDGGAGSTSSWTFVNGLPGVAYDV